MGIVAPSEPSPGCTTTAPERVSPSRMIVTPILAAATPAYWDAGVVVRETGSNTAPTQALSDFPREIISQFFFFSSTEYSG